MEKVYPIGNSPTFMSFEDMRRAMPIFLNMSMTVFKDKAANKVYIGMMCAHGSSIPHLYVHTV